MEKTLNLEEVYNKLKIIEQPMITKRELDSALESIMVYSNEDTMRQIEESKKDIEFGKIKKISSVKDI
mgnify:FL=1